MKLKRTIALLLALVMLLAVFPVPGLAEETSDSPSCSCENGIHLEDCIYYADPNADLDAGLDAQQDTDPDAGTETDPDAGTDTDPDAGAKVPELCTVCSQDPCACCQECHQYESHGDACSRKPCPTCGNAPCTCSQEPEAPQVGDKIWIQRGSSVYKEIQGKKGHTLLSSYEVEIVDISTDETGLETWYEFRFTSLGIGELLLNNYKFVLAGNTTNEKPQEPVVPSMDCTCDDSGAQLGLHQENCPRRLLIASMIQGSAEEIHKNWETYDETVQTLILELLEKVDKEKLEVLKTLLQKIEYALEVILEEGIKMTAGVPISAKVTDENKIAAIASALGRTKSSDKSVKQPEYHYFDIDAETEEATITIEGVTDSNKYRKVYVTHLLDSAEAIRAAEADTTLRYINGAPEDFPRETAAAKEYDGSENRVYYTERIAELDEDGNVTFQTDSFSTFLFTVCFEYDGLRYELNGGTQTTLSAIMQAVGLGSNVSNVAEVSFSNPALIQIQRENGDWTITSLESFSTVEWLYITLKDGTVKEIRVTDPVVYYYLDGTEFDNRMTNVPFTVRGVADKSKTYRANETVISNYGDGKVTIFARPNMMLRFQRGPAWPYGGWNPETSIAGVYVHSDGWEWIIRDVQEGENGYNSSVDASLRHENCAYILDTDEYKTIKISLGIRAGDPSGLPADSTVEVTIFVVPYDQPLLLSDALAADTSGDEDIEELSIVTIPVTLFNYDGIAFNEANQYNGQTEYGFIGTSLGQNANSTVTLINGSGLNKSEPQAKLGIMKDELVNGYPVMNYVNRQPALFQKNAVSGTEIDGKTSYNDVNFEFVYNETTGVYTYSSYLNHAQYDQSSNTVQLYRQSMGASEFLASQNNRQGWGGFYPFADINDAFVSSRARGLNMLDGSSLNNDETTVATVESNRDLSAWADELKKPYDLSKEYYAQLVNSLSDTGATATNPYGQGTTDMHFGMHVHASFYMPKDKHINGKEMVYQFSGDDDVWVFINGKLALDLGGGHQARTGTLNLTTGNWWVDMAETVTGANATDLSIDEKSGLRHEIADLPGDRVYTIDIFYLERHSGESNCYMSFNLPIIPASGLSVKKEVVADDGKPLTVLPDEEYTFQLYIDDDKTPSLGDEHDKAVNYPYTILNSDGKTLYTDDDGCFKLKHGQIAMFDIPRFAPGADEDGWQATKVFVSEYIDVSNYVYPQTDVLLNNTVIDYTREDGRTDNLIKVSHMEAPVEMQAQRTQGLVFRNYMEAEPLVIEKSVVGGRLATTRDDMQDPYKVELTFIPPEGKSLVAQLDTTGIWPPLEDSAVLENNALSIALTGSASIQLPRVPVNLDYEVVELDPGPGFVAPTYTYSVGAAAQAPVDTPEQKTMTAGGVNKVLITNEQRADLIIQKRGTNETLDENQTSLFHVVGKSGHNSHVDLIVAVYENGEIRIPDVPVGTYEVTELVDWNWRYEIDNSENLVQTVGNTGFAVSGDRLEKTFTFTNERKISQWLDGYSWCRNLFTGSGIQSDNKGGN